MNISALQSDWTKSVYKIVEFGGGWTGEQWYNRTLCEADPHKKVLVGMHMPTVQSRLAEAGGGSWHEDPVRGLSFCLCLPDSRGKQTLKMF